MTNHHRASRSALIAAGLLFLLPGPLFAAPPSTPANVGAWSPAAGNADITWNDVSNETFYELMWGPFPPGPTMTISSIPANQTSYALINLSSSVSYHFKVRACNSEGCSPFSGVIGRTPDGAQGLPGVPAKLTVMTTQAGTNVATWDDVLNETSYELMWGAFPPGPTTPLALPANRLHNIFTGLGSGTTYHFQIRACNTGGCSDWSEIVGRTPNGSDECVLVQNGWHATGTATIKYVIGTKVPATWKVWAVTSAGVFSIISFALPAFAPVATGDISFAYPPTGVAGFMTALTTPAGGLRCSDFDTVNTGTGPGLASTD